MSLEAVGLERRALPRQRRAHERIGRILAAAEQLLATTAVENITTTTIAAAAGVPVSSIYRYFPNIQAIYKEMFEGLMEALHGKVAEIVDDVARWPTWRARHRQVMATMRALLDNNPAYPRLFQLMLSTRELRAVKERANAGVAGHLAARWSRGEDGFRGGDPLAVARMATEIVTSFEALVTADPALSDALFKEAGVALESYLSVYLSDDA